MDNGDLNQLASWIKESKYTVVLTGAGMSTESGIPDFRSSKGWWRNIDPREVASKFALDNQYELFRDFYIMRINGLKNCKPNKGHIILAHWEKRGLVDSIATQNVDRFHQEAGSDNVYELHGNIRTIRCEECAAGAELEEFVGKKPCRKCGGRLRPNVVLFGESLPHDAFNNTIKAISKADLVIVIGTSLQVYPVNQLPELCKGKKVYINMDVDSKHNQFDLIIKGSSGEILSSVNMLL
ncbi:MAG: SIR2 family NAD-dependent protein deacylase [Lutispora sp.]|jgi:NAD-dependent deacetylase|uniref:SIR2 family NAD-dependent protein deacylase n=1 Tax=Lutispora sp. TaxID=2828727 RepID=UPI003564960E